MEKYLELDVFSEIMDKLNISPDEIEELEGILEQKNKKEFDKIFQTQNKKELMKNMLEKYFLSLYYCWLINKLKFTKIRDGVSEGKCIEDFEYGLESEDNLNRVELLNLYNEFPDMRINKIKEIPNEDRSIEMMNYKSKYENIEKRVKHLKNVKLNLLIEDIMENLENMPLYLEIDEEKKMFLKEMYKNENPNVVAQIYDELNKTKDIEVISNAISKKSQNYAGRKLFGKKFAFDLHHFYVEEGYNYKALKYARKGKPVDKKDLDKLKINLIELYMSKGKLNKMQAEAFILKELLGIPYFLKDTSKEILDGISSFLTTKEIIDEFNGSLAKLSTENVKEILPKLERELEKIEEIENFND